MDKSVKFTCYSIINQSFFFLIYKPSKCLWSLLLSLSVITVDSHIFTSTGHVNGQLKRRHSHLIRHTAHHSFIGQHPSNQDHWSKDYCNAQSSQERRKKEETWLKGLVCDFCGDRLLILEFFEMLSHYKSQIMDSQRAVRSWETKWKLQD